MTFDIEKRAREQNMFPFLEPDQFVTGSVDVWRGRAIQLAREAADARAEEIAAKCAERESTVPGLDEKTPLPYYAGSRDAWRAASRLARSTITKPEIGIVHDQQTATEAIIGAQREGWRWAIWPAGKSSRPLTLAECKSWGVEAGASVECDWNGFTIIQPAPKTREQVLEEALREIEPALRELQRESRNLGDHEYAAAHEMARMKLSGSIHAALTWRPEP
jgi:hypothetical protein